MAGAAAGGVRCAAPRGFRCFLLWRRSPGGCASAQPAEASGNRNAVQAVASSVSYGKRYTASALLNLTSHGEDDDAFSGVGGRPSEE